MTMIERVAEVLANQLGSKAVNIINSKEWFEKLAKIVILAMAEPTPEMVQCGDDVRCNGSQHWHEGNDTKSIYRSMIDIASKDVE